MPEASRSGSFFFKELEQTGKYCIDDDYVYRCAIFTFSDLLDETLDNIFEWWNTHTMRKCSKNPGGVPDFLYAHPEMFGGIESGRSVPPMLVEYCHTAFPGSDADLDNLFGVNADRPVFSVALRLKGLFPVTRNNMLTAFLYLIEIRDALSVHLPA